MIRVLCGVIVNEDGRILLARRGPGMDLEGLWEFPGGKIEPGETPEEGLRRELEEELGIAVEVGEFLAESQHEMPGKTILLQAWWCRLVGSDKIHPREHAEVKWESAGHLMDHEWCPADIPLALATVNAFAS